MSPVAERPRILIVDDHDENLLALEAVLDGPNYELVRANSGRGALRAALQGDFAVILLDVAMPDMDGYETAALLRERERSRHTPIIFLTANYRGEGHMFRGYSVGAVDYLTKPFSPEVLKSKVAIFVELYETRQAITRHAQALQRAHDELEQRVQARTTELAEATVRAQELRAHAEEANRLKDEFLATLSHELRTPLNAIVGWTHLLELPNDEPGMTARAIAAIKNNALAQSQIVEDILDVSRIIGGKLQLRLSRVAIDEVIEAAIDAVLPAAAAKGITLERHLEPSEPAVMDRDRIQQVCWNVLSNAVKFTPKGGRVTIRAHQRDDEIVIIVADTGIGIAPDFLPYLFDRFRQGDSSASRRHGGLGLGMAIVRHLVELHGGTVHAESAGPGHGATFTVTLPRRDAVPADPPAEVHGPRLHPVRSTTFQTMPSLAGQRVVVAVADAETRVQIGDALREAGAEVFVTADGARALALVEKNNVTALVSEVELSTMDGFDLIRRVRRLPTPPHLLAAIALSGAVSGEEAQVATNAGYDLHLSTPVDLVNLINALDTLTTVRRD